MHTLGKVVAVTIQTPLLRSVLSPAYRRYFDHATGNRRMFRGIFADFAEASAAVPKERAIGYDNPASARRVAHERHNLPVYDYPVLFWLARLLRPDIRIFDWGGNVGITYHAFARHLSYPAGLEWVVNDVPAVLDLGREMAAEEGVDALAFTAGFDKLETADVLLSLGALQCIETPFEPLRRARARPTHVLINKIPVHDQPGAVTLQNMGTALSPYHLFNRAALVTGFEALGYELVDAWDNPGLGCFIPFHRAYAIDGFSGFYFRRRGQS